MSKRTKAGKKKCVVPNCDGRNADCFPMNEQNQLLWLYKINNDDSWVNLKMTETQYICSSHFKPEELKSGYNHIPKYTLPTLNIRKKNRTRTNVDAIPSTSKEVVPAKELKITLRQMCCACLRNEGWVMLSTKWDGGQELISDVIKEITGIQVNACKIPLCICLACLRQLRSVRKFKEKMTRSCKTLKKFFDGRIDDRGEQDQPDQNEQGQLLNNEENEVEIIDVDAYQESTPSVNIYGDNVSFQVRNEITRQISNIIENVIMPNIRERGYDIPSEYIAENGVALFKNLMNISRQRDKRTAYTQTMVINKTPKITSTVENNIEKLPVIVLDEDDTGFTNSAITIPQTSTVKQLAQKPNNFGIVYPPTISNITQTTATQISCTNNTVLPNRENPQVYDSNISFKRPRLDEWKSVLHKPILPKPHAESEAETNAHENRITTKTLNKSKRPNNILSTSGITPCLPTKTLVLSKQIDDIPILTDVSTINTASINLPSISVTNINEQKTSIPTVIQNSNLDILNAFPSTSIANTTLYVPVKNQISNESTTWNYPLKILKRNQIAKNTIVANVVNQSVTPSLKDFNPVLGSAEKSNHALLGQKINASNIINKVVNDGTCVTPYSFNPIGFTNNILPKKNQLHKLSQSVNGTNVTASVPNGLNFLSKPHKTHYLLPLEKNHQPPQYYIAANVSTNNNTLPNPEDATISNGIATNKKESPVTVTNPHPDVEDYLSQNFIAVEQPNENGNSSNVAPQELPKIMKVQEMAGNKCQSIRIKVRNLSELQ